MSEFVLKYSKYSLAEGIFGREKCQFCLPNFSAKYMMSPFCRQTGTELGGQSHCVGIFWHATSMDGSDWTMLLPIIGYVCNNVVIDLI